MNKPEYLRVYNDLRSLIENGTYKLNDLLPPEPKLEEIYGVSRTTVRRAVSLLANAHLVKIKQGYGTKVVAAREQLSDHMFRFHNVPQITETVFTDNKSRDISEMHIDVVAASPTIAKALEVESGSNVYRIQRISLLDDTIPFSYKISYLPMALFPNFEEFDQSKFKLYLLLQEEYHITFDHGSETVTAVAADFLDSQILKVKIGAPLLLFTRYAYTSAGPMEYAETKVRPEYYELRVHMNGAPSFSSPCQESELVSAQSSAPKSYSLET